MIYVTHGDNKKLLTLDQFSEGTLTNAIIEVTREQRIKIYFPTGLGELDFEVAKPGMSPSANPRSLSAFKDYLEIYSMEVESLDIGSKGPAGVVIEGVYTWPELRSRGLASALVAAVAKEVLADFPLVCLHVAESNAPARRSYEKCGMVEVDACQLMLRG